MEKIIDTEDTLVYRLQCRCLEPKDARDIAIELEELKPQVVIYGAYVTGWRSWKERIVDIWHIFTGREYLCDSIVIREEDLRSLGKFFTDAADNYERRR